MSYVMEVVVEGPIFGSKDFGTLIFHMYIRAPNEWIEVHGLSCVDSKIPWPRHVNLSLYT